MSLPERTPRRTSKIRHPTSAFPLPYFKMRQVTFEIQAECPVTRARAGVLHTAHGDVETPVFMPVGTQATVKGLSQRDLPEDLDTRILLGNTYPLYLRPGHELIERLGGLQRFMSWPRASPLSFSSIVHSAPRKRAA